MDRSALLEMFLKFLDWLFKTETTKKIVQISAIPRKGDKTKDVGLLQNAINEYRGKVVLKVDDDFGGMTETEIASIQKENKLAGSGVIGPKTLEILGLQVSNETPDPGQKQNTSWFSEGKKHSGKVETNAAFQTYMNPFWGKSGLPNFKGLVGSARAWCGLFLFMCFFVAGYQTPKNAFRAKAWDTFGQAIDWKTNGIPQGATLRINSSGNCTSDSGNHVTMSNGDCVASDLTKSGATIDGFGGNQGNAVKVSTYSMKNVCSVRWPDLDLKGNKVQLPQKVTQSKNCTSKGSTTESTR